MTYKVFANGNPLQASEINENLMQQAVAVFTDATARDAAISVPVNGQFAYLTGTSNLTKYTGAAWEDALSGLPITTEGDLVIGDGSGEAARIGIGAADTILTSNGTTATWAAAGGGGFNTISEVTASDATYDTSAISGFVKITLVGGGAGGSSANMSGSNGGNTSINIGGTTTSAIGGRGFAAADNTTPLGSSNGGYGKAAKSDSSQNGYGGAIKIIYADLTAVSSVNITIGAGGTGGNASEAYAGSIGITLLEYAV